MQRRTGTDPDWVCMNILRLERAARTRKPTVFSIWNDLFHEKVTDTELHRAFTWMALAPQHTWLVLTKRAERMREYVEDAIQPARYTKAPWGQRGPLFNVGLGVTVENQARADERIPHLLATPAAVRFISAEPLLGPLDLTTGLGPGLRLGKTRWEAAHGLDWVIAGGETGPSARPMHIDWVRKIHDDCAAAGVPFFFKGWGEWLPGGQMSCCGEFRGPGPGPSALGGLTHWRPSLPKGEPWVRYLDYPVNAVRVGRKRAGRTLDGRTHDEFPWEEVTP
jgi:protein gp37